MGCSKDGLFLFMDILGILDFPGVIQKGFGSVKNFDIETAGYQIVENFEKGFLTEGNIAV